MSSPKQLPAVIKEWSEWSMHRSGRDFKRFMDDTGLSFSHVSILMRLYHHGGKGGISDMGSHLGVSIAAASQAVEQLVQRGLVERSEAPADRRVKRLVLTEAGRNLIEQGITARSRWIESLAKALSPTQQEQIVAALELLTEAARRTEE